MTQRHRLLPLLALSLCCIACDEPAPTVDAALPPGDAGVSEADAATADDAGAPGDAAADAGRGDGGRGVDAAFDAGPPSGHPEVDAPAGRFRGRREDSLDVFRGIPFAESTAGERRFSRPVPRAPIAFLDAVESGPGCPRFNRMGQAAGVEDCLELNIWRPSDTSAGPRPVMVFIHGGAFVTGSADEGIYVGDDLSLEGVILVTIQYRIGLLGWLASEELSAEAPDGLGGNYGLRDQILALEWVQQNVGAFGGDASNVTVFGESAGAMSICTLLATPSADGLFQRAVVESAPGCELPARAEAEQVGAELTAAAGCDGASSPLACLRAASTDALLEAADSVRGGLMGGPRLRPWADGSFVRARDASSPAGLDVPLLVGSNLEEGEGFVSMRSSISTRAELMSYLGDQFGANAQAVADLYPALAPDAPPAAVEAALGALWTDVAFRCTAIELAQTHDASGAATYLYEYRRRTSLFPTSAPLAAHGYELFHLFNVFPGLARPDADDDALSAAMQTVWTDLAEGGDLSSHVAPFASSPGARLVLDAPVSTDNPSADVVRCDALAELGVRFGT